MDSLTKTKIRNIDEARVRRLLKFPKAFDAIQQSYALFSDGKSTTPLTTAMRINGGMFFCFSSHLHGSRFFISKLATFYPSNREKGLPSIQPRILVFDSAEGRLLAEIEARYFAAIRTAISSAVGVSNLLPKLPIRLAILGSGVQAESHAVVLTSLFNSLKEMRVYSPTLARRKDFVERMQKKLKGVAVTDCETAELAIADADVIACVTDSKVPVFSSYTVKEGALILSVGSMGKEMQEIPDETMEKSLVVVDSVNEISNYGEIAGPRLRRYTITIAGEIGEIISGKKQLEQENKIIVFKHHGLPVTDAALAELLYLESEI